MRHNDRHDPQCFFLLAMSPFAFSHSRFTGPLLVHLKGRRTTWRQLHQLTSACPISPMMHLWWEGPRYLSHSNSVLYTPVPSTPSHLQGTNQPYVHRYNIRLMEMSLLLLTRVLGFFAWHPAPLKTPLWTRSQHREVAWVSQGLTGPHEVVSEQGSLSNCSARPFHSLSMELN